MSILIECIKLYLLFIILLFSLWQEEDISKLLNITKVLSINLILYLILLSSKTDIFD